MFIETIYSDPDFLEHYGVKGMHWGVRKEESSSSKTTGQNKNQSDWGSRKDQYVDTKSKEYYREQYKAFNRELADFNNKNRKQLNNFKKEAKAVRRKTDLRFREEVRNGKIKDSSSYNMDRYYHNSPEFKALYKKYKRVLLEDQAIRVKYHDVTKAFWNKQQLNDPEAKEIYDKVFSSISDH